MTLSVVLASCRAPELLAAAVGRLLPQCRRVGAELIVARATSVEQDVELEGCRLIPVRRDATIPEIRGAGMAAATGDWVLLTEDNCVARYDWVERLRSGFGTEVEVVGGTMGNAYPGSPIDAGAFFAEYGGFGPTPAVPVPGRPPRITGANVAYRGTVAPQVADWARAGQWEGVIHDRLAASGARFSVVSDAVVEQNLHYRLGEFCRDRFEHARDYAMVRSSGLGLARRLFMTGASPLLPVVLGWRAWCSAGRSSSRSFLRSLPLTLIFLSAWAAGESVGYLRGGGNRERE